MAMFQLLIEVSPRPDVTRTVSVITSGDHILKECMRKIEPFTSDDLSVLAIVQRIKKGADNAYCVCLDGVLVNIIRINNPSDLSAREFITHLSI